MASRHSRDLTRGSVFKNLVLFAVPILLSNMLQQLYHAADVVVVGNFSADTTVSLAAVGSSGSVTTLLLNMFFGLSLGSNVVCANLYGAKKHEDLQKAMGTALIVAAIGGIFIGAVGFFLAGPILAAMGVPESVLPHAVVYMKIIFLGQPGSLIYNFGAGILRSYGDTKRPMMILSVSGVVNFVLNFVLVAFFHLDSAGVAIATIIAHYVSAAAVLFLISRPAGEQRLDLLHLHFDVSLFKKICRIGIPGGLNGMVFSISNVIIANAVFSLGDVVVAGDSAASSVTNLVYQVLAAFYSACVSFAGQNYDAKRFDRIDRLFWQSILLCGGCLLVFSVVINLFPNFFMRLFTNDPAVMEAGKSRLMVVGYSYILYTVSEMAIGCLRGMGKSVFPTALNAVMICVPRLLWIAFVFPLYPTLEMVYLCYAVSYVLSGAAQSFCYFYCMHREKRALKAADTASAAV